MTDPTLIQRIKDLTARFGKGWHDGIQIDASDIADLCLAADALEQQAADLAYVKAASVFNLMEENKRQAAQIEALRGQHAVLVRLLVEADKVLGTIEGECQEEWDMLLQLRRCITAATMPHRPEGADLLSVRERLGC